MLKLDELRQMFLDYFKSKDHMHLPSDSLVPKSGDPSLLFTGAGMNQFKNYFMGVAKPPHPRATTSQKCLRTGDIEKVGKTPAHHTFFEMLGNFSFGDYFKAEVIPFAWEFLTVKLQIPPEKLFISVYEEDDEAYNIWRDKMKVAPDHIMRFGEASNYWPASAPSEGPNGPCGPCSEIYYDYGPKYGCGLPGCTVGCDCSRYVEIWNLVFMQFERQDMGVLVPLKKKNIDTGMGLERLAAVMQGVMSNFDTDLFKHLIGHVTDILKVEYNANNEQGARIRRISDHIRALVFMVADGVMPSNEGRGYVERRLLRRAVRDGMNLGADKPFLYRLVPVVVELMGGAYPELKDKHVQISRVIKAEEEKFLETVESGLKLVEEITADLTRKKINLFPGDEAFKLYDTYGFPVDLTEAILYEKGFKLDMVAYQKALTGQRELSRAGSKIASSIFSKTVIDEIRDLLKETEYIGDETLSATVKVEAILIDGKSYPEFPNQDITDLSKELMIITDKTPFYGESGGQVGDIGRFSNEFAELEISDTQKMEKYVLHIARLKKGALKTRMVIKAEVNQERRQAISCNHTATHLLHHALRKVIGATVEQSGSLVLPDRLRFDYTMSQSPKDSELRAVEDLVNRDVRANSKVTINNMAITEAKKLGAMALFTEKYGDVVRVITVGDYSTELCGGSHIKQTGEIGYFRIQSDSSIAAGIRRIEAVTAEEAIKNSLENEKLLHQSAELLQTTERQLPAKIKQTLERLKVAQSKVAEQSKQDNKQIANALLSRAENIKGIRVISEVMEDKSLEDLRAVADYLKTSGESVIALLGVVSDGKANLILMMTPKLCKDDFNAGGMIKEIAPIIEGSGGGRKELAQAGGKKIERLQDALFQFMALVKHKLK